MRKEWFAKCVFLNLLSLLIIIVTVIWLFSAPFSGVKTREEMIMNVKKDQLILNNIVEELKEKKTPEIAHKIHFLERNNLDKKTRKLINKIFEKYPLSSIYTYGANSDSDIKFVCTHPPSGCTYWGFYYSYDGLPKEWAIGVPFTNDGSAYRQSGSGFKYYTEFILDHWYYYETLAY